MNSRLGQFLIGITAAAAMVYAGASRALDITGAGATFPYPVYAKWAEAYKAQTGIGMNYQSIGSGGGIRQVTEGTVDFGASDGPMTDEEIAARSLLLEQFGDRVHVEIGKTLRRTR